METSSPSVVLAAYAEPLLEARRVAVFGDATSSLGDELLERGARVVHLYDPDAARAAEAATRNRSKQVSVLPLDTADIAVRDGAFDVAIITDLASIKEPAQLLKRVRRALSPRGAAIVATPNPDAKLALMPRTMAGRASAISYYDLFDSVSAEFSEVRMLGQTPFVGYAVVDFAPEGSPEVSLDSGLVPGGAEEPEWFVAVASASPIEIDAFSIVQLPMAHVVRRAEGPDPRAADETRAARASEARLVEEVAALKVERAERLAAAAEAGPAHERLRALEAELAERDVRLAELRARAAAADAKASDAHVELEKLRETEKRVASLEAAHADLVKQSALHREEKERLEMRLTAEHVAEKERLERRIAEHVGEKERLEMRLREREQDVERLVAASAGDSPDDVARLEAALKDRGERIRRLESDLREAERVGKELVRELSSGSAGSRSGGAEPPPPPLLSGENARLRADLEAAGWTIQELEGRLSPAPALPR